MLRTVPIPPARAASASSATGAPHELDDRRANRLPDERPSPTARARLAAIGMLASIVDLILSRLHSYRAFLWMVSSAPPTLLTTLGRWRAIRTVELARRRVPAYRRFAASQAVTSADVVALDLPETDKASYVTRFGLVERCIDGQLPASALAIDESSGSTGMPFNWIRSLDERNTSRLMVGHFARYLFGSGPLVTINAFTMGAWATGVNMGIALEQNGIVKNTGPDPEKILKTLAFLGTKHRYLICAYPPFLKQLMDCADEQGFPLEGYTIHALVGGEGMSEGLRDYVSRCFSPVYSGYGATDIEIGLGGETPLSVAIRRQARSDAELRRAVFGDDPRLPMLFQYNPLSHHVTVNSCGELVFTITRSEVLSPRVAYNVHDEGGIMSFAQMRETLRSLGLELADLPGLKGRRHLSLPFLWVSGRSDSTLSVMGANVYPEDIEQALYDEPELAAMTNSFCLGLEEEEGSGAVRPCFSFELRPEAAEDGGAPELIRRTFEERITRRVVDINADYREAMDENEAQVRPVVRLYSPGSGPFAADRSRIKQTRLVRGAGS